MTLLAPFAMNAIMNDWRRKHQPQPEDEDERAHEPVLARDAHGKPYIRDEQPRSERNHEANFGRHQVAHLRSLLRGRLRPRTVKVELEHELALVHLAGCPDALLQAEADGRAWPIAEVGKSSHAEFVTRAVVPPQGVMEFADVVMSSIDAIRPGLLVGAYLHGSAALGGWTPSRSDVDVLLIADEPCAGEPALIGRSLLSHAGDCPGRGQEVSVVTVAQARRPLAPWPFVVHLNTAADPSIVVSGDGVPGDPDLLMRYVTCRSAGWRLTGPEGRQERESERRPGESARVFVNAARDALRSAASQSLD